MNRLGVDDVTAISQVFKTPFFLRKAYLKCIEDEKHISNLLNTGKLLLLKDKSLFENFIQPSLIENEDSDLPEFTDNSDTILGDVVLAAQPKTFRKLISQFNKEGGKMRKINKNSCLMIHQLLSLGAYPS